MAYFMNDGLNGLVGLIVVKSCFTASGCGSSGSGQSFGCFRWLPATL
jgi:hypothetical protein